HRRAYAAPLAFFFESLIIVSSCSPQAIQCHPRLLSDLGLERLADNCFQRLPRFRSAHSLQYDHGAPFAEALQGEVNAEVGQDLSRSHPHLKEGISDLSLPQIEHGGLAELFQCSRSLR